MNDGIFLRDGFEELFKQFSGTVQVHKNWGASNQKTIELRGMKNNEKNRIDKVMFQFLERVDVQIGDLIQQKGARDLWRVYDVEDEVIGDTFLQFEAKVEKVTGGKPTSHTAGVVIHGSVIGGVQVGSHGSTQAVNINISQLDTTIQKLREILEKADIPALDKEDGMIALTRIQDLGHRPKTPDIVARIKEKVGIVANIFTISKSSAELATPYLAWIAEKFLS